MTDLTRALLAELADGRFHSGEALARQFGRSRAAVWKHITRLSGFGLEVHAVRGRGYRLAGPIDILDSGVILALVDRAARESLRDIDLQFHVSSTNDYLLACTSLHGRAVLAEYQSAGRGRRGSRWLAPPASGICLSVGWHFDAGPESLILLSLVIAVAVLRALRGCGVQGPGVKWPNDIVFQGRKLGGILIESRGQIAGPVDVVVGVGLNVRLPQAVRETVDQPVTDIVSIQKAVPSRNALAAATIGEILRALQQAHGDGFREYVEEWRRHDVGRGRSASIRLADGELQGQVLDIDQNGLLIMLIDGRTRRFSSGELSLRLQP